MALTSFLFLLLLLTLLAAANPVVVNWSPVTLPLARFINFTGVHNLLQHDQACAQVLKNRAFGRGSTPAAIIDEPATNRLVSYITSVGFGSQLANEHLMPPPSIRLALARHNTQIYCVVDQIEFIVHPLQCHHPQHEEQTLQHILPHKRDCPSQVRAVLPKGIHVGLDVYHVLSDVDL
ncbi:uncharacterized protein LACBIDRAFT_317413 [Laccaria bicolor S238N-H82]|uniref:Predicted protein n=1 Tax=Laccaria bicolor (strain S238N-H82 / ATCC MYA-4686) TaxID=486041 RepID=B0D545_LACBS|nr:uncharacterized protein LACBIDRAFT_317413 [Laccaria bicolor S238N-H82]EDR10672.1 predicted protein [Laccaria bicolor S238N-H82]|eukprot:XP_001879122.1 predicted protein [Laccaria bicolor S238N-H82]